MKLMYFVPALFNSGGTERVITEKVNYLADILDYEIIIVTTDHPADKNIFYPLSKRINVIYLEINYLSHFNKKLPQKLLIHYKKQKKYKKEVEILIEKENPDICISTCGKEIDFFYQLKTKKPKIAEIHFSMNVREQVINMYHKGLFWSMLGKIRTNQLKNAVKKLDRIIVLTTQDKANWERDLNNVMMIPNPIYKVSDLMHDMTSSSAIAVGRLDMQKGFDMLIDSWKIVAQVHPRWTLDIYGEGVMKDVLEEKIRNNNLEQVVFLKGSTKEIEKEYLKSSFYVMSSRFEGLPMVLLEAMNYGLPLISFDCECGPRDLIENGQNGFLVEPDNIKELAVKINELIENQKMQENMSFKSKSYSKKYDIKNIMKQWDNLFKNL